MAVSNIRSFNMSQIKGKNTKPELFIRRLLWQQGYRYQMHYKDLPGKPDIIFKKKKKAIFVHGCFWHKHFCKKFVWPATNTKFWKKKITDNVNRDKRNYNELSNLGWQVLVIWQCEMKKDDDILLNKLTRFINE